MKPKMFNDEYYIRCLRLAMNSKGNERYGSIIVSNGEVLGEGFNRAIAHSAFGKLEREIRQGMANHAEIEALNDALGKGHIVSGSEVYVAGFFPNSGKLFFHSDYTCLKCIPYLADFGIENILVPAPDKWVKKSLECAHKEASKYAGGTHEKRIKSIIGRFSVSGLAL